MKTIQNGRPWYDIDGKKMYAQFPHIVYHNNKYYLYGSNKEFSNDKNGIWHWGIRIYESTDLYSWKDLGLIIPPDETNKASPLNPYNKMDAPCIIYNEKTKKWVCWLIDMAAQTAFTLISDSLFGPYTFVNNGFKPCGFSIGDFDIAISKDKKAYIYFNNPHTQVVCAELTEDYTDVNGNHTTLLHHPEGVPFARESPAYFERNDKHYLFTSGTTAYHPNPSEIAVADDYFGHFRVLGNPHINDDSNTSFHSQIRSVFKVPNKKDLYIALADRWLPQYMHVPYEKYKQWFKVWHSGGSDVEKARVGAEHQSYNIVADVSKAEYIMLPITFENEKVSIYWRDSWSLDEFE